MTTSFSSLPLIDLSSLSTPSRHAELSKTLHDVFSTTGFAYLVNAPLSFSHEELFTIARAFFSLPAEKKLDLAKKSFRCENSNTYRGYFPTQPNLAPDNLKEGFEIGPPSSSQPKPNQTNLNTTENTHEKEKRINLTEPNVWPNQSLFPYRCQLETLYNELQSLSRQLLSLLAISLGQPPSFFDAYLTNSLSTLRLLHYPPSLSPKDISEDAKSHQHDEQEGNAQGGEGGGDEKAIKLSCSPHTDSGILTLLHQDATGGLEVQNANGEWVAAPYIPGSIVVNVGDLMARISGGVFVATMHRVRSVRGVSSLCSSGESCADAGLAIGRISVPFFFEPGEDCLIRSVKGGDEGVKYGDHVTAKMKTWVEFRDETRSK